MLNTRISECGAIILAAGQSIRMGKPKFLLEHPSGGTFLSYLINIYLRSGISELVVVVNDSDFRKHQETLQNIGKRVQLIINRHPEKGRLYSIQLGVSALSSIRPCFIHNIDNPFMSKDLLNQLFDHLGTLDFIKPVFDKKGGHPLLLSEKIIGVLRDNESEFQDFRQLLDVFNGIRLEVDYQEVLLNINSRKDYDSFFQSTPT